MLKLDNIPKDFYTNKEYVIEWKKDKNWIPTVNNKLHLRYKIIGYMANYGRVYRYKENN